YLRSCSHSAAAQSRILEANKAILQTLLSSKHNLSFHGFPSDPELRRQWLVNIHRYKLKLTPHSKVCGLHFTPDQLLQSKTTGGRGMENKGGVPVLLYGITSVFSLKEQNQCLCLTVLLLLHAAIL
uniref:THAP domain-containing protein 1 n=1 Tax=Xiphophorus couchianus TaxID=32473 RepID=A0A3B5LJJ2_9TELE